MSEVNIEGLALADGVVETIISIAVQDIDGVASVGARAPQGLLGAFARPSTQGIEVGLNDNDALDVAVHVEVFYGSVLPDVAAQIRENVANALLSQVGLNTSSVDVYIDAIRFE